MLSQPYAVPTSYDGRLWEHWAPHAKAGILPGVKRGFGFGIRTQAQQHRYGVAGSLFICARFFLAGRVPETPIDRGGYTLRGLFFYETLLSL